MCAPTGLNIYESAAGEPVANWWQPNTTYIGDARGTATKACDTIRDLVVRFQDLTVPAGQPCSFNIPQYTSLGYFKYGINPPSRFESYFYYSTGDSCLGVPHIIRATMSNSNNGTVYGSVDLTFAP